MDEDETKINEQDDISVLAALASLFGAKENYYHFETYNSLVDTKIHFQISCILHID